ncbi:unannotated protein [freshwater metagenome]|uniref:Unannotated protein n=1 Tax=freshwater metagenome TaxID=449393 RepID=A0A6J6BSA7_9ZZZZ
MDDSGSLTSRNVVGDQDLPRVVHAFGVCVVVPQARVGDSGEVGSDKSGGHGLVCRCSIVVAQFRSVCADGVRGQEEFFAVGGCAVRSGGNHGIPNGRTNRERRVGRQGPRGGCPGKSRNPDETEGFSLRPGQREGDSDGLVLTRFVDIIVHPQFVVGQWGLVTPAIRQDAVSLVCQTFVVQLLERPNHTLHKRDVESLVVVFEVDPARLTSDVLFPLLGVLQH